MHQFLEGKFRKQSTHTAGAPARIDGEGKVHYSTACILQHFIVCHVYHSNMLYSDCIIVMLLALDWRRIQGSCLLPVFFHQTVWCTLGCSCVGKDNQLAWVCPASNLGVDGPKLFGRVRESRQCIEGRVLVVPVNPSSTWEFPKTGDPNIVPCRNLIIRTLNPKP